MSLGYNGSMKGRRCHMIDLLANLLTLLLLTLFAIWGIALVVSLTLFIVLWIYGVVVRFIKWW